MQMFPVGWSRLPRNALSVRSRDGFAREMMRTRASCEGWYLQRQEKASSLWRERSWGWDDAGNPTGWFGAHVRQMGLQ